ncbi:MAG: hypothetical protein AAF242_17690 [Bacteroidota bacterium]
MYLYEKLVLLIIFIGSTLPPLSANPADTGQLAQVVFDLDACTSYRSNGTNFDYSEFTGAITNSTSASIQVLNGGLYRENPMTNAHSCTPGFDGNEAMCISYDDNCDYDAGNEASAIIDLRITPLTSGAVSLSELSFYELAPESFDWIDGPSGSNNYPTQFGVRILKNNEVVFVQSGLATQQTWSLNTFDLSQIPEMTITEETDFRFEFLGYCPVGRDAQQAVWDLDDVSISVGRSQPQGGTLTGGPFEFTAGDGVAEYLRSNCRRRGCG